jgi:isocitrate dehydrogenase (NAD+)
MAHRITLIPGDGIGPEISEATRKVIDATGVPIEWDVVEAGEAMIAKTGNPLPSQVIESVQRNKVAIKGPITTPVGKGFRSVNVGLRKALDLYANVRPCKTRKGVRSLYQDIDLVVVRENTEDLYAGIEFEQGRPDTTELIDWIADKTGAAIRPDSAISIKPISITGSRRIVEFAFKYAENNGRRKVTAVHKANIMTATDGLYLQVAEQVAAEHPNVQFENVIVDNMCMQLVQKPDLYDVLVLPNLYGDIISDLAAGLVGGLGIVPGANIGDHHAIFEAVHGTAPDIAGKGLANPTALMQSAVLMLAHLGERDASARLQSAIERVYAEGKNLTGDVGGKATTAEFTNAVIAKL